MKTIELKELGIAGDGVAYRNLPVAALTEAALERGEGRLSDTGALVVERPENIPAVPRRISLSSTQRRSMTRSRGER